MLDPVDLLEVARDLAGLTGKGVHTEAHLRRAVSTAYYAIFHRVLGEAADRFVGAHRQHSAAYSVLYRAFDHTHVRRTCIALQASTLNDRYKRILGRSSLSDEARSFAAAVPRLQEARHLADYDPTASFLPSDTHSLIDLAEVANADFDLISDEERTDFLSLLLFKARD